MSFGEFMFSAGFTQKTTKKDLNIKRYRGIILWHIHGNFLEDTRGLHTEIGLETLPGGARRPHPCAAQPLWWEAATSFWSILSLLPRMHLSHT
jgi:hypothetical protein